MFIYVTAIAQIKKNVLLKYVYLVQEESSIWSFEVLLTFQAFLQNQRLQSPELTLYESVKTRFFIFVSCVQDKKYFWKIIF